MLKLVDLTLSYRSRQGDVIALRDVSVALEFGKITTLLGPNAAG